MNCPRCGDTIIEDSGLKKYVTKFYICHDCGYKIPNPYYMKPPKIRVPPLRVKIPRNCYHLHEKKFPPRTLPRNLVSIIILNYNTLRVTANCIRSVLARTVHPFELIVVDNGSSDGSVEWLRKQRYLKLIAIGKNCGFSIANNVGITQARGRNVCLLNSDIIVRGKGWLRKMVSCVSASVGTVGAKLLYKNGKIQHIGGGIHELNPYHPYDKYSPNIRAAKVNRDVPYNTGACLLITRTALNKVGLLDESYPFGFEDVDYGLKVVEKGLRNVVCMGAVLTHLWAYTQRKTGRFLKTGSLRRYHHLWDLKLPELAKKIQLDWGAPYAKKS